MLVAAALVGAAGPTRDEGAGGPTTAPATTIIPDTGLDLTRLLLDKPAVPVTPPLGVEKPPPRAEVPVEGTMVVDRLCRLTHDAKSPWLVLAFEPEPPQRDEPPRRALPCRLLEQMEEQAAAPGGFLFRVSGETTVYQDAGYLLLTKAMVLAESPPAPKPVAAAPAPPSAAPAPPAAGDPPATRPAASRPDGGAPSSDDILGELLGEKVGRPMAPAPVRPEVVAAPSVAPVTREALPPDRGSMVVDRLVRIVLEPEGAWWAARFEADNTLQEPPMRLLPCTMLDRAVTVQTEQPLANGIVFRVSGVITHYKGQRYLLLRKLLVERDLGRF